MARASRSAKKSPWKLHVELHSEGARRAAAMVLDVLAGVRSPAGAAEALGVTPLRYLALERRALEGLLGGCEPRSRGPRRSAEHEAAALRRDKVRLERESARNAALLRIAQRTFGLRATQCDKRPDKGSRGRKRRKPTVRALRVAQKLRATPIVPVDNPGDGAENDPA